MNDAEKQDRITALEAQIDFKQDQITDLQDQIADLRQERDELLCPFKPGDVAVFITTGVSRKVVGIKGDEIILEVGGGRVCTTPWARGWRLQEPKP